MDLGALIERPPPGYILVRRQGEDYEEFEVTPIGFAWGKSDWAVQAPQAIIISEVHRVPGAGGRDNFGATEETHADSHAVGNTHGELGKQRRRGRKRKARNPMGRPLKDPFGAAAEQYIAKIAPFRSESTVRELRRKLGYIGEMFAELHQRGVIPSLDPKAFDQTTIGNFCRYMETRKFSSEYRYKILTHLGLLLESVSNNVVKELRKFGMLPKKPALKPIPWKDEGWLRDALRALDSLEGWSAEIVRFALQVYFWTGLRVRELRLAKLTDLDTQTWTMRISAPKGLGRWASSGEKLLIVPALRPSIVDYFDARAKMLGRMEISTAEPLIPDTYGRYYSCERWNSIRFKVFRQAGIRGDFRTLRPSFAMKLKELGLGLEDRSRILRHTSTETTAKYYSNMESLEPWERVEERLAALAKKA